MRTLAMLSFRDEKTASEADRPVIPIGVVAAEVGIGDMDHARRDIGLPGGATEMNRSGAELREEVEVGSRAGDSVKRAKRTLQQFHVGLD